METKLTLRDDTVDALQDLIEVNIDSASCLEEAADAVDDDSLTQFFTHIATHRRAHASELQSYVAANREEPETEGSFGGEARKLWVNLRSAINGGDPKVVLIEAERARPGRVPVSL